MRVRKSRAVAVGAVLVMTAAIGASYGLGLREGLSRGPGPTATVSPAPPVLAGLSPSPVPPLTPIALGRSDVGTILFADGLVWKFEGATGQLQPLFAGPSQSRGHAITVEVGGQAGIIDARDPRSPIIPPGERADQQTADLSSDGSRFAYLVDGRLRINEVGPGGSSRDYAKDWRFSSVRWSPSGRYLAATGLAPARDPAWPKDVRPERVDLVPATIYVVDLAADAVRPLWVPQGEARPPLPPARRPIQFISWSPDERYVLLRHPSVAAGVDSNGTEMFALEIATGAVTPLGVAVPIFSWIAWRAPHTLAYTEGQGFDPWENKRIRLWAPETGFRDVTGPGEVAVSPSWDAAGRLLFVKAAAGDMAADASHLASFDPVAGRTTELLQDPAFAEHAVRVSGDGRTLLLVRRRLSEPLLEMWTASAEGTDPRPLWRFTPFWTANDPYTREHAIYQAAGIFDLVAWSR